MCNRVEAGALGGSEVGLIVQQGTGMGAALGCRLGQQVLGDAGQQVVHPLSCAATITSACHTGTRMGTALIVPGWGGGMVGVALSK